MVTLVLLALMMAAALGVMLSVVSIRRQVREVEAAGKQAEFESLEHQTLEPRHPDLWDHGPECGVCRYLRAKRVSGAGGPAGRVAELQVPSRREGLEHKALAPRDPDEWNHGPDCGVCQYLRARRVCTPHHGEHNWVEVRLDGARLFEQCRWCGERS